MIYFFWTVKVAPCTPDPTTKLKRSSLYAFARPPFADGNMVEAEVEVHLDAAAMVLQKWAFSGDNFRTTFCVKVLDRAANALGKDRWRRINAGWADRDSEILDLEKQYALLESANAVCLRWSCKELKIYKIDSTYTQAIIRCDAGRFCSCVEQAPACAWCSPALRSLLAEFVLQYSN